MAKAQHPKIHLSNGVCTVGPPVRGKPQMPKITPPKDNSNQNTKPGLDKEEIIELAKTMAKEMAIEMSKNIQPTTIIQQGGVVDPEKDDNIELESSFIDPSESENFSVNLDNVKTSDGSSIKEKLAKLKELKGK